jgi:hypothetical protein
VHRKPLQRAADPVTPCRKPGTNRSRSASTKTGGLTHGCALRSVAGTFPLHVTPVPGTLPAERLRVRPDVEESRELCGRPLPSEPRPSERDCLSCRLWAAWGGWQTRSLGCSWGCPTYSRSATACCCLCSTGAGCGPTLRYERLWSGRRRFAWRRRLRAPRTNWRRRRRSGQGRPRGSKRWS